MYQSMTPVAPISPAVGYCGGKRLLAKRICPLIDAIPHTSYVEPFCGMGGVFFRRQRRPRSEVINDLNLDVATFFRVARRHPEALLTELEYQVTSRSDFDRLRKASATSLTDIERAARFFYLQRCAFGGRVTEQAFGVRRGGHAGLFCASKASEFISMLHKRLAKVVVEALPYQDIITRYDTSDTLFYLDPPYHGSEQLYGKGMFERGDYARLAEQLAAIRGRFILSLNDHPDIRQAFVAFEQLEVSTNYTVGRRDGKQANELIISNVSLTVP